MTAVEVAAAVMEGAAPLALGGVVMTLGVGVDDLSASAEEDDG